MLSAIESHPQQTLPDNFPTSGEDELLGHGLQTLTEHFSVHGWKSQEDELSSTPTSVNLQSVIKGSINLNLSFDCFHRGDAASPQHVHGFPLN